MFKIISFGSICFLRSRLRYLYNKINFDLQSSRQMQQEKGIEFKVGYQYEQSRLGKQIFWQLCKDFNIATWMEQYYPLNSANNDKFTIDVVDLRQLKRTQQPNEIGENQWVFLIQDKNDDDRIRKCLSQKDGEYLKGLSFDDKLSEIEKNKKLIPSPEQLYLYVLLWQAGLDKLNNYLNNNNGHIINTYSQIEVSFFLKNTEQTILPYFIIKQSLPQLKIQISKQSKKIHYNQTEYIFDLTNNKLHQQYQVVHRGQIGDLNEYQLRDKQLRGIDNGSTIKNLIITMNINGKIQQVFGKLKDLKESRSIDYFSIDYNCARNKFTYLKKNLILREGKKFSEQHYNLAFQGGGAKGFAYVGAYKALKQHKINKKEIPIKSIMGSSAGGIVAIAASTGISWRQIEAICYKMNTIPATDRIEYSQVQGGAKPIENTDQFGNEINFQTLQHDFKQLFIQYGIMTESLFNVFSNFLKGDTFRNEIQQKLVKFLEIMDPSISQIFSIKTEQTITPPCWQFWKKEHTVQRVFNWSGLAFHGALMKGEAIHRIAAECIIRYFYKQIAEKGKQKLYERLKDAFRENPLIMNQSSKSSAIQKLQIFRTAIRNLVKQGSSLLNAKIGVLVPKREKLLQFLVYLVNSTLFKLDILCSQKHEQGSRQGSVDIGQLKQDNFSQYFYFKEEKIQIERKKQEKRQEVQQEHRINDSRAEVQKKKQQKDDFIIKNLQLIKYNRQTNLKLILKQLKYYLAKISQKQQNPKRKQQSKLKDKQDKIKKQLLKRQGQENQFIPIVKYLIQSLEKKKAYCKADIRQIMEQFSSMNEKNENNQNNQKTCIRQITEKLKKIIENTAQNQQPKFQSILPFTKRLFAFKSKIKYLLACRTYNQINAVSNTTNFINHKHLKLAENEKIQDITVKQFLQDCFVNKVDPNKLVGLSEKKIVFNIENLEIDKVIFDYLFAKGKQKNAVMSKQIIDYDKAYDKLVSACQTMTMKEYYALTGIELTCTSVDLDDHILRLFNHKTTPNLPVCRAIQMTGSFPVAFKAQRWRPEWGLYHVQKKGKMASIDITGHQFTDGGLLANFPIKYFDNPYISYQYFAHTREEGKTIMLGFGLDQLEAGTYQLSQEEVEKANKVNIQKAKALTELKESFPKLCLGIKVFFRSTWFKCDENEVKLGELDRLIHEKIPLFRFLSKLVRAYPNADRNLNIQAFQNRVFMVDMRDTNDSPTSQFLINYDEKIDKSDKDAKNKQLNKLKLQRQWDLQNYFRQFKKFKIALHIYALEQEEKAVKKAQKQKDIAKKEVQESRQQELQQKRRILRLKEIVLQQKRTILLQQRRILEQNQRKEKQNMKDWKQAIENNLKGLENIYKGRIGKIKKEYQQQYQQLLKKQKENQKQKKQQKQMSLYLLKILRIALSDYTLTGQKKNKKEKAKNQEIHIALSERYAFLKFLAEEKQINGEKNKNISLDTKIPVKQFLNESSLRKLFDSNNFEEISRHLNFKNVQQDYIQAAQEDYGLSAQDLSDPQKMTTYVKKGLFDKIKQKLKVSEHYFFANPGQYYVKQSLRRLTQYVFLQVKCKLPIYKNNLKKLCTIIKNTEYSLLISPDENLDYLTFNEILDFMHQLATTGVQLSKSKQLIVFQNDFLTYLTDVKTPKQDNRQIKMNRQRIEVTLKNDLQRLINQKDKNNQLSPQLQQSIKQILIIPQVISLSTAVLKSQLKLQQNKNKIRQYLNEKDEKLRTQFLTFVLEGPRLRKEKTDLSVFNEGHMKTVQQNSLKTLKLLYFGSKYDQLKYEKANVFSDQFKNITNSIEQQRRQCLNEIEFNIVVDQSKTSFAPIQKSAMQFLYSKTLYKYIIYRINNKQTSKKQIRMLEEFNRLYFQDISYILKFIKTIVLLVINLNPRRHRQIILLINPTRNRQQVQANNVYENIVKDLTSCYDSIFHNFNEKYQKLSESSENQISLETLNQAFLIKLNDMQNLMVSLEKFRYIKNSEIHQTINNFIFRNFSLPFLNTDISNLLKFENIPFCSVINTQNYQHLDEKNNRLKTAEQFLFQVKNHLQLKYGKENKTTSINLHLLLQGIGNACDYYPSYYQFIKKIMDKKIQIQFSPKIQLKVISCSGFHSIFGFLLTLGKDIEVIREDMLRIRQSAYQKFDGDKIDQFFQKQGHYYATQNYASLSKSLTVELSTVFQRFQTFIKQKPQKFNYQKCFKDIRLLIEEQQRYYTQSCNKILDESMLKIKNIQKQQFDILKPKQIAKAFAFDYECRIDNHIHEYNSKDLKKTKQLYLYIVKHMFEQFGEILSAVICDTIASNSPLITDPDQIKQFTKGKLIGRMLTVYKLKAFIYEQLQASGFPRNITLNEYFQRSKPENQIVLNFLCVNVSEQRLQMLNKVQTPKMPLWAAILASSSLPIIHRNFWCEREWEELEISDKYHDIKRLQFFGSKASVQREKTFYNSSFYISSLPIELITNTTFNTQFATYDEQFSKTVPNLYCIAVAFNPKYSGNLSQKIIKRKFFKLSPGNIVKFLCESESKKEPGSNKHDRRHFNKSYDKQFGTVSALLSGLKTSSAMNTFGTLSEANDNFIMKWYFNRLIRLPIKFGTLDFGEIVDEKIYNKFKIQIPSSKAHETTLRSYHITKTFIHNIQKRHSSKIQRQKQAQLQQSEDRYLVHIRASIIKVPNSSSGYDKDYYSIVFINHSKWNRNIYNNFAIDYAVYDDHSINTKFKRVDNSEISWETQLSTKIKVKFYYLSVQYDNKSGNYNSKDTKILFTEFILDFNSLNKSLPFRPTFDYSFNFAWDKNSDQRLKMLKRQGAKIVRINQETKLEILPYKMNNVNIKAVNFTLFPQLLISICKKQKNERQNPYLERFDYSFPQS